jgi:hypothetical protein
VDAHPLDRKALFALGEALEKQGERAEAFEIFAPLAGETRVYDPALLAPLRESARSASESWSGTPVPGPASKSSREEWTEHFIVTHRCSPQFARALGSAAEHHLRRIWGALGSKVDLETIWERPARLIVFEDPEAYRRVHPLSEWSMAHMYLSVKGGKLADHGVRMLQTSPVRAGPVLPHEIGHLVFHGLTGLRTDIPLWMHEGFALWCEPVTRKPHMRLHAGYGVLAGETFPLASFLVGHAYPKAKVDLFYCQAFSLFEFLVERRSILDLVETASHRIEGPEPLAIALGFRNVKDFEEQWKAWVRKSALREEK